MDGKLPFLTGGGRAADKIGTFDWARTPLGPMAQWPQSLKTSLSTMLLSRFPKAIAWGPDLITFHNDAFEPILGEKPPAIGRSFRDVWAEAWSELQPMVDKAFRGEATFIENFKLTVNRYGYPEEAFFTFCYSPIRAENGEVGGMMDTVIETTATVRTQHRLAMTNAELSHRMRNALTMVTAVAGMSLKHAAGLEEARTDLMQRLAALGRSQAFLSDGAGASDIAELIEGAFEAHSALRAQVRAEGGTCQLGTNQALALSLALNELITNSIKYGALSSPAGSVHVNWVPEGFRFAWRESGVVLGEPPTREGFGTKVLMQFVPASFSGQAHRSYASNGLIYEIKAPPGAVS